MSFLDPIKQKWQLTAAGDKRKILFMSIVGGVLGVLMLLRPHATDDAIKAQQAQQTQTTQLVTPEIKKPTIDDLAGQAAQIQQTAKEQAEAKLKSADAALAQSDQSTRVMADQYSDLAKQLSTVQEEMRLQKMSNPQTSSVNNVPLPPLPGLENTNDPSYNASALNAVGMPSGHPTSPDASTNLPVASPAPAANTGLAYYRKSGNAVTPTTGSDLNMPLTPTATAAAAVAPASSVQTNLGLPKSNQLMTTGSILQGVLLNGMDAPASTQGQNNPVPTLIRIKAEAVLPNRYHQNVRECFVLASGLGDLSSERARLRTEKLACIFKDGTVVDKVISGYIVGEDGKVGMRGRVVTKQGALIARAVGASFLEGFGEALSPTSVSALNVAPGSTQQYQNPDFGMAAKQAGYKGIGTGFQKASDFYMDLARQMVPVIEIDAERKVTIILTNSVSLESGKE